MNKKNVCYILQNAETGAIICVCDSLLKAQRIRALKQYKLGIKIYLLTAEKK